MSRPAGSSPGALKRLVAPQPAAAEPAASFQTMLDAEREEILKRRDVHFAESDARGDLVGLALSGGGIRSATFCLGLLQGLDRLNALRVFDYLSTVSGGGFAGGWLNAWLTRRLSASTDDEAIARELIAKGLAPDDGGLAKALDDLDRARRDATAGRPAGPAAARAALARALDGELSDLGYGPARPLVPPRPVGRAIPDEKLEPEREGLYARGMGDGGLSAGRDPVHHLRLFSNYLTPRKGLLSLDTWRAVAVVSRNLILTWLVLVPVLLAAILAGQLYYVAQRFDVTVAREFTRDHVVSLRERADRRPQVAAGLRTEGPVSATLGTSAAAPRFVIDWRLVHTRGSVAAELLLPIVVALVCLTILWMRFNNAGLPITHRLSLAAIVATLGGGILLVTISPGPDPRRACSGVLACLADRLGDPGPWDIVILLIAAAAFVEIWRTARVRGRPTSILSGREKQLLSNRVTHWSGAGLVLLVAAGLALLFSGFAHELMWFLFELGGVATLPGALATLGTALTAAGAIFTALKAAPAGGADARRAATPGLTTRLVFGLTPPLVLVVLATLGAWATHEVLRYFAEVRVPKRLMLLTIEAFVGIGVCLAFAAYEAAEGHAKEQRQATRLGVLVGVAPVAVLILGASLNEGRIFQLDRLGYLRSAFILSFLGWGTVLALAWKYQGPGSNRLRPIWLARGCIVALLLLHLTLGLRPRTIYAALALLTITGSWVVGLGWMADPNALSLHAFYRARLVRAYLGASNPRRGRRDTRVTDAVPGDDVELHRVDTCGAGGPYHLVNTTLNLVGGRDLTAAQRTAASFVLGKRYCGSLRTGYRRTETYMAGKLTLGAAVAASGAAVSPNMGSRTPTAALAMLLALLNVRLGFWVPTPNRPHWRQPQARLWPYYLLSDMLLQTTDLTSYCYLTDGGHFDNSGLYSLVERGCRFIVVVDNGADPGPSFADIGEAIRRCRIDFGAEIRLGIEGLQRSRPMRVREGRPGRELATIVPSGGAAVSQHCTLGTIEYAPAHADGLGWDPAWPRTGVIVWLKPSLLDRCPPDVRQYGLENTDFPQQTTADQWFDEAQFESYRRLGEHYAHCIFGPAAASIPSALSRDAVAAFFRALQTAGAQACTEP